MTENEAQKKLDMFRIVLNEVWDRFEDKFFNGQEIVQTLEEMETLIHRFLEGIRKRNSDEGSACKHS